MGRLAEKSRTTPSEYIRYILGMYLIETGADIEDIVRSFNKNDKSMVASVSRCNLRKKLVECVNTYHNG